MGGRFFGGADHGSQGVGLERRAWPLAQGVSGSVGSQGTATNVPALRVGTESVLAIARAFSRWRSGLRWANATNCTTSLPPGSGMQRQWKQNCLSKQIGSSAATMPCWGLTTLRYPRKARIRWVVLRNMLRRRARAPIARPWYRW